MTPNIVRAVAGIAVLSVLVSTVVFAGSAAAQTAGPPVCAGNASDFEGGNGTESAPYEIATVGQLQCVGDGAHLDDHFELVNDIDASATAGWHNGSGFAPIGNDSDQFTGTYDGQGFIVSDLVINRSDEDSVGLFGSMGSGGTVTDVGVENASVAGADDVGGLIGRIEAGGSHGNVSESYTTGTISGSDRVGGLVGANQGGAVSGSYATGTVSGTGSTVGGLVGDNAFGTVSESYASSAVSGTNQVGGLVGENLIDTVSQSYATGDVSGADNVGGLVGFNHGGTVSESYATGSVSGADDVGGLVGQNRETITHEIGIVSASYATGTVSGDHRVGGLVGFNFISTVSASYATGTVSGDHWVGGLVGSNDEGTVSGSYWDLNTSGQPDSHPLLFGTGLTTAEMTGEAAIDHMTGLDVPGTFVLNESYPHLRFQDDLGGDGSAADPYEIRNGYHLQSTAGDLSASYVLTEDVDASATASWHNGSGFAPIGNINVSDQFTGTFDGQGFIVSDLVINRSDEDYVGVFGVIGRGGAISNVGLENVSVDGAVRVGGLAGRNEGDVSASYATGSVSGTDRVGGLVGHHVVHTVSESHAIGTVSGRHSVGGLVGWNEGGTLSESYATGSVSGTNLVGGLVGVNGDTVSESYAAGNVSGARDVGGLAGSNEDGTVSRSYTTGSVSGTRNVGGLVGYNDFGTVSESYATGSVSGSDRVGGLIGIFLTGTVSESYATGSVSGADDVGGLIGQNVATVSESYWNEDTNDANLTGVGVGSTTGVSNLTTAEMQGADAESNMTGFDYHDPWTLTDEYPHLQWEVETLTLALDDTVLEAGDTTDAMVTLHLADDSTVTASSVANYTSDDSSVATVTHGTVTANGPGDASLTAEHAGLDDAASLTVESKDSGSGPGSNPRLDPASFELSDLAVDTDSIRTGESVTVTATVTNVGERTGTHQVTLGLDGTGIRVTSVTLDGGAAETVTLTHTFDVAGEYALALDGRALGTLSVRDPTPTPSTTTTPAASPPPSSSPTASSSATVSPDASTIETPGQSGFGLAIAVIAGLVAVLLGGRRRP